MERIVVFVFSVFFLKGWALFGQISISQTHGINIGNAITVTGGDIQVDKPFKSNLLNQVLVLPELVTLDFPKCDLRIGNGVSFSSGSGPIIISPASTSINPSHMNYGFLMPSVTDYMDLGSATMRFRSLYVKTLYSYETKSLSDARYKENIADLTDADDKLMALRPVTFDFIVADSLQDTAGMKDRVGFLAQEMQGVLPHLVSYLPEANLFMADYVSIIPYLVQAYQQGNVEKEDLKRKVGDLQQQVGDLQQQVTDQQQQIDALEDMVRLFLNRTGHRPGQSPARAPQAEGENVPVNQTDNGQAQSLRQPAGNDRQGQAINPSGKLFQNIPNPFSGRTTIRYALSKTAENASILLYDTQGQVIKHIPLPQVHGNGQIEISGGEISPGTYTYSLLVSGNIVDTKRMVLVR